MQNLLVQIAECFSVCVEFISANLALIQTNKFCTFLFPYDIYTFSELIFAGIYILKELIFAGIKFRGCLSTFLNFVGSKFHGKLNAVNFAGI